MIFVFDLKTTFMNEQNKDPETKTPANEIDDPVTAGKKAIDAHNELNKQDKSNEQKDKEEKEDAANWRNEG